MASRVLSFQDYPRPVRDYISEKRPGAASQQSRLDDAVAAHEVLLWLYARDPVAFDALVWDRQLSQSEAWDQAVILLTFRKKANGALGARHFVWVRLRQSYPRVFLSDPPSSQLHNTDL